MTLTERQKKSIGKVAKTIVGNGSFDRVRYLIVLLGLLAQDDFAYFVDLGSPNDLPGFGSLPLDLHRFFDIIMRNKLPFDFTSDVSPNSWKSREVLDELFNQLRNRLKRRIQNLTAVTDLTLVQEHPELLSKMLQADALRKNNLPAPPIDKIMDDYVSADDPITRFTLKQQFEQYYKALSALFGLQPTTAIAGKMIYAQKLKIVNVDELINKARTGRLITSGREGPYSPGVWAAFWIGVVALAYSSSLPFIFAIMAGLISGQVLYFIHLAFVFVPIVMNIGLAVFVSTKRQQFMARKREQYRDKLAHKVPSYWELLEQENITFHIRDNEIFSPRADNRRAQDGGLDPLSSPAGAAAYVGA